MEEKTLMSKRDTIPGGGFILARRIFNSEIWLKPPLYLKVWIWILGRANHSDLKKGGRVFKRWEFVSTYDEIIKAAAHYHNRKHVVPTLKQIRIILAWLEGQVMIAVQPIRASERPTGADPRARTRAYVGIKIVIINYDSYQDLNHYKGRHKGRPSVQLGHNNNNEEGKYILSGKKTGRKKTNPGVKKFIDWWSNTFKTKFGTKYHVIGSKEGAIVKRLLSTDPYEDLVKLAERFFDSEDSFIKDAGYTIGVFSSQINKLKTQGQQRHAKYAT
jgi:hypothetical protein